MGDWSLRKTHSFQTWCQKTIVSIFGDAVAKVPLSDPVIVDLMFFFTNNRSPSDWKMHYHYSH